MKLVNKSIYLKHPSYEELILTKNLLACDKTMSFNAKWGGTVDFDETKWNGFYENYLSGKSKNIYFHIYNLDNTFVGEVSSRYIKEEDVYMLNIKIKHEFRGNHHAADTLDVYFDYLFDEKDANRVIDDVASDNIGAIKLLTGLGMRVIKTTDVITLLEIKKEDRI